MGQQMRNMCELSASGYNIKSWTVQCFSLSLLFVLLHCRCLFYQVVSSSGNLIQCYSNSGNLEWWLLAKFRVSSKLPSYLIESFLTKLLGESILGSILGLLLNAKKKQTQKPTKLKLCILVSGSVMDLPFDM